jgi:hypothetical protein
VSSCSAEGELIITAANHCAVGRSEELVYSGKRDMNMAIAHQKCGAFIQTKAGGLQAGVSLANETMESG